MDITLLSAQDLARRFAARELSPVEVAVATFERIEAMQALDTPLRLFTWTGRDAALQAAHRAERAWRERRDNHPLCGVPFSVKDCLAVRAAPRTHGSALFGGQLCAHDDPAVARLRAAGAVFVGMNNMPEFGHRPTNQNAHYGTALNPWDARRTPGGSSGGSAASVAVGASTLALGTDAGGSVRVPAACCGVLGLKATHGLIPSDDPPDGFGSLGQTGPMARTVHDLATVLQTIAGPHAGDPWSQAAPPATGLREAAEAGRSLRAIPGLRLRWLPFMAGGEGAEGLDAEVRALCEQALARLAGAGAGVEEGHVDLGASSAILGAVAAAVNQHRFGDLLREHAAALPPTFRQRLQAGARLGREPLLQGLHGRTAMFRQVQALFEQADVVATPTLSAPAVLAEAEPSADLIIDGQAWGPLRTAWIHHCHPFNLSGHPALTVPVGWTRAGLPVGLQLVGPWHGELRLLQLAAALECLAPWAQQRPPCVAPV
ncbi:MULTISPECIES: amidase [Delftia]|uniref:amidase n=1 Tax=Delftia TaxID=80865 RepID=UPI0007AE64CE|nr:MULTISPECIES: amidase [Delftia]KZK25963.1 hypothetical protein A4F85_27665 [Delftia sp. GW456-R20]MBD9584100.1 amidase [Delftia sp. DLF01]WAT86511.1 amidase [Delftia acidovorans]